MVAKILHIKLNIEQHEHHSNTGYQALKTLSYILYIHVYIHTWKLSFNNYHIITNNKMGLKQTFFIKRTLFATFAPTWIISQVIRITLVKNPVVRIEGIFASKELRLVAYVKHLFIFTIMPKLWTISIK
jgi:hypothetical protein